MLNDVNVSGLKSRIDAHKPAHIIEYINQLLLLLLSM